MKVNVDTENHRYKDILLALAAASEYQQPLARLPLQKLIYLGDVLSLLWREIASSPGFAPYHHGPYDSRIQNAVDALVFRGFVQVTGLSFRKVRNTECRYQLTENGYHAIQTLTKRTAIADDAELFKEIAREIQKRGWENIKQLVYAEPTYETARAAGESQRLRTDLPSRNLSLQITRAFRDALQRNGGVCMSRRNLVQMFFALLDEYRNSAEWELSSEHV